MEGFESRLHVECPPRPPSQDCTSYYVDIEESLNSSFEAFGVNSMNMYNTCRDLSCCFRLQILSDIILAGASKTSCGVPNKTANPLTLLMEPLDIHFIKPATFHKQIEMTLWGDYFIQESGGGSKPIYMNKCLLHKQFMLTLLTDC